MTKPAKGGLKALGLGIALLASAASYAVDGVILIDQNRALTGGVTPGDAAGFPVTISQPGSYRLASNLILPNADTTAIRIDADHVTLDLNGFAILGPIDCSGGGCPFVARGNGITNGVTTPRFNLTIRNGTVQGTGGEGISLYGDGNRVENMHVRSNNLSGIVLSDSLDGASSAVLNCTAQRNGGAGIVVRRGIVAYNKCRRKRKRRHSHWWWLRQRHCAV